MCSNCRKGSPGLVEIMYTTWSIPDALQLDSSAECVISIWKADFIARSLISDSTIFSRRRAAAVRVFESA